jgi:Tol biopolymer transport system component
MDKHRALKLLQGHLDTVPKLRHLPRFSNEFKRWKRDAGVDIRKIFGEESGQFYEFKNISYSPSTRNRRQRFTTQDYNNIFQYGLNEAAILISSMIREIEEHGLEDINKRSPEIKEEQIEPQTSRLEYWAIIGASLTLVLAIFWFLYDRSFESLIGILGAASFLAGSTTISRARTMGLSLILIGVAVTGLAIVLYQQRSSVLPPRNAPLVIDMPQAASTPGIPTTTLVSSLTPTITQLHPTEPATVTVTQTIASPPLTDTSVALISLGTIVSVSDRAGDPHIFIMNPDGSIIEQLTVTGTNESPNWSPDGTKIAFHSNRRNPGSGDFAIYVMDADGSDLQVLTDTYNVWDGVPTWSPNGENIAFEAGPANDDGLHELFIIDVDSRESQSLNRWGRYPAWSPDGNLIAFHSVNEDGQVDIYTSDTKGQNIQQVTNDLDTDLAPAWSRDGLSIIFTSVSEQGYDLFEIDATGGEKTQLTRKGDILPMPVTWSPDGKLAFTVGNDARKQIFLMAENTNVADQLVVEQGGNYWWPTWSHPSHHSED